MADDIERLKKALINADSAGDTEAAKMLASRIRMLQTPTEQASEVTEPTLGSEAQAIGVQALEGAAALPDVLLGGGQPLASPQAQPDSPLYSPYSKGPNLAFGERSQPATEALSDLGVPVGLRPETGTGQFLGDVAEFVGSSVIPAAGLIAKGAKAVSVVIGETLSALSAAVGGRVTDDKETGQLIGALVGAGLPTALSGLVRKGLRGDQKSAQKAFDILEKGGVTPTPALIAEKGAAREISSAIKLIPGGSKINNAIKNASKQIGTRLERIVGKGELSSEVAGRVIKKGITGEAGFVSRFKDTSEKLYGKIKVGDQVTSSIKNTKEILVELSPTIEGAEAFGDLLANPIVQQIKSATGEIDNLPFKSLQQLRSIVGRKLSSPDLVSDVPRAELKRLYGALSDDLKIAADGAGLGKEFARANDFYKGGIKRIDDFLDGIQGKLPEKILPTLISGGKEGATQIRALRKSMNPDEWSTVAKSTLKRLGSETGGQADEFGVGFSSERLLTNLNNMSDEARGAFFGGVKGINKNDIDALAESAAILRRATREGLNPSGSAQGNAKVAIITALSGIGGAGAAVGSLYPAAVAVTTMLGANASARLLTNPAFAKWLVRSTKLPASLVPSHISRLSVIANKNPEIAEEVNGFIKVFEEQ